MKLFEEFKLYETVWDEPLTEAKSDYDKLFNFAPGGAPRLFLNLRHSLKSPENDLYYWIKNKTPEEFENFVYQLEDDRRLRAAETGAALVVENDNWKVYSITTYEASEKYGRDTRWCVAGNNGSGTKYWYAYVETRGAKLYYFITKQNYDPRGDTSKYALAYYDGYYELYDQQDKPVASIPNAPKIPELSEDFSKPIPFDNFIYRGGRIGDSKVFRKYLTKVIIQEGITEITSSGFMSCENLKECTIPDSVISIDNSAFYNCPNLVIKCNKNSYAEQFAKEHNIPIQFEESFIATRNKKFKEAYSIIDDFKTYEHLWD